MAVEVVTVARAQVAYFLSWPVLGSAVILAWQPSPGEMTHMVKDSGIANETQLHDVRHMRDVNRFKLHSEIYRNHHVTTAMPMDKLWLVSESTPSFDAAISRSQHEPSYNAG